MAAITGDGTHLVATFAPDVDLTLDVLCSDPTCEHDHPPAVARLIGLFECHTAHWLLCEFCLKAWAGVIVQLFPGPLVCLSCERVHFCLAALHYQLDPL